MMAKNEEPLEEMTVELSLDNGQDVTCAVITILEVEGQDYIVLLPLDEKGENQEGEVWFYRYSENPDDPNEEPELDYIDSDEEYEKVADAFDEFLDNQEFDEFLPDEERRLLYVGMTRARDRLEILYQTGTKEHTEAFSPLPEEPL